MKTEKKKEKKKKLLKKTPLFPNQKTKYSLSVIYKKKSNLESIPSCLFYQVQQHHFKDAW